MSAPRVLSLTVPAALAGRRLGAVLKGELRLSNALYKSLKWRSGAILLNGSPAGVNALVRAGDVLSVALGERRPPSPHVAPCALPLDVLYEDADLLVLNKPAGVSMHEKTRGAVFPAAPTLAGALRTRLGAETAAHFVNRLDKGTSGLCIAAKSGYIHDRFRVALHTGAFRREYRAFAEGRVEPLRGVIDRPIGPAEGDGLRYCVRPDGRPARTEYEALAQSERFAFLRLLPQTGRTHQLRVHMSAAGHPLAGDLRYGAADGNVIARPALHSFALRFTHPVTGEKLSFTAPLPEDMAALLSFL